MILADLALIFAAIIMGIPAAVMTWLWRAWKWRK